MVHALFQEAPRKGRCAPSSPPRAWAAVAPSIQEPRPRGRTTGRGSLVTAARALTRPDHLLMDSSVMVTEARICGPAFSVKGQDCKYLGFEGHMASVTPTQHCCSRRRAAMDNRYVKERLLHSNKTSRTQTSKLHIVFTSQNISLFLIFSNHLKI